jgi:hypothetical protein
MDNDGICGEQTSVRREENSESEGDLNSPDLSFLVCLTIFGCNRQRNRRTDGMESMMDSIITQNPRQPYHNIMNLWFQEGVTVGERCDVSTHVFAFI